MHRVRVAARAVLLELETIWVVTAVLARDVVAVLAVVARHRDLRANVVLGHAVQLPLVLGGTFYVRAVLRSYGPNE